MKNTNIMLEFEPKAILKTMKTIYLALLLAPCLFIVLTMLQIKEEYTIKFEPSDPLQLVLVILFVVIIPTSIIVKNKRISQIKPDDRLQSKLASFQTTLIIRSALWVGVANLGIVISMISENLFPISIAILALLFVASFYPGVNSIQKTCSLNSTEIKLLLK